jgi:hypothetical protein
MKRNITIQPNLAAWLKAYPLDEFPIMPVGFKRLRLKFRHQFNLSHDILRHTFISMFVGKFRSLGDAALQAGNSEAIIRKHYLDLKSPEEATQFFGILPKKARRPTMACTTRLPARNHRTDPLSNLVEFDRGERADGTLHADFIGRDDPVRQDKAVMLEFS